MDPRVRALLEPKAYAKGGKATSKKQSEASASTSSLESPHSMKHNNNLPSHSPTKRSVPSYDPKRLLDPRGARKAAKPRRPTPPLDIDTSEHAMSSTRNTLPIVQSGGEHGGSRSMIEDLYGIERRVEPPMKRAKLESNSEINNAKGKGSARTHHSSGIVGEYMRRNVDEEDQITDHNKIVDLTNLDDDDNDDDVKILKARNISNDQEVCYGNLTTTVHAHAIPHPRKIAAQNLYGDANQWPSVKCKVARMPSKNTVIEVKDAEDFTFGRIEPDLASILTPCLDGLKKFSLEPRLTPRKKRLGDIPRQPCSQIMKVTINVYGRRADAERVGKILGQRNTWLSNPIMAKPGVETVNPHMDRYKTPILQGRPSQRNQLYSETRTVEEATEAVTRLFDHYANTTRPLSETEANAIILTPLLPHQKQALTFMMQREQPRTYGDMESENSSLWRKKRKANGLVLFEEAVTGIKLNQEPDEVYGGLLADVMGLGKTIEALALIANTRQDAIDYGNQPVVRKDASDSMLITQSRATLIVAPVSTVKNWEDQINEHTAPGSVSFYVYHGAGRERDIYKLGKYDIIISTYSTIASECSAKSLGISPIRAIRWFRIILDEAHTIRESRANQSQAMYSLFAQRRWCLTGTPIQNRLDDLGSLTRFLRLYPYDTTMRFNQYIRAPAQSGDDNYLKALRIFIDSFTLRRLKDRVDLPARKEVFETLEISADERKLHDFFKERASVQIQEMSEERKQRTVSQHHVLRAIMTLRLICDHGRELLKEEDLEAFKGNSASDAIDVDDDNAGSPPSITPRAAYETLALLVEAELDLCRQCDRKIGGDSPRVEADNTDEIRGFMLPCFDLFCHDCFEKYKPRIDDMGDEQTIKCPACSSTVAAQYVAIPKTTAEMLDWAPEQTSNEISETYKKGTYTGPSTKVKALLDDLNDIRQEGAQLVAKGEPPLKSVVFSEFTSYLDLIEKGLDGDGFENSYVRIDGSMSLLKRRTVLDRLNNDDSVTILLASIKAAGQGLNLTAASYAFIMEPMWNPAAEMQAVDRIHRIGQKRNVMVKRYRINDSIEGKIVELQRKKQALADISMNKNHTLLSKKESREQSMKEILSLFK